MTMMRIMRRRRSRSRSRSRFPEVLGFGVQR